MATRGKIQCGRQFSGSCALVCRRKSRRGGFHEKRICKFFFQSRLILAGGFPDVGMTGDPRTTGFRHLKQALGDVLSMPKASRDAAPTKGTPAIGSPDRSVFAKGSCLTGKTTRCAGRRRFRQLSSAAWGVRGHHSSLATLQGFRQHFCAAGADQPGALLADAVGTASYLSGSRPESPSPDARETSCRRSVAEEDPDAESFLSRVMGVISCQFLVISEKTDVGRLFWLGSELTMEAVERVHS